MTKQMNIENVDLEITQVAGNVYVTSHPIHGPLMVELATGVEEDEDGEGNIVSTQAVRARYAVPLPEWEAWAHDKWGVEAVREAKRLLWMTP